MKLEVNQTKEVEINENIFKAQHYMAIQYIMAKKYKSIRIKRTFPNKKLSKYLYKGPENSNGILREESTKISWYNPIRPNKIEETILSHN